MFGCRTVASCALSLALVVGCGGSTSHGSGVDVGGSAGQGTQTAGSGGVSSGGNISRAGSAGATAGSRNLGGGGSETDPDPIDTGCKPEDLPPPELECDPFGVNTCGPGSACYPFVEHPDNGDCGSQVYGARCLTTGSGTQGQLCGEEVGDWCAAGHVCVVGQRAGKRCAALCKPGIPDQCTGGLICGDLDVDGYGVCG